MAMTFKQLGNFYGIETVNNILAMMGAGWTTDDTPEEIARYHEISLEDAQEIHEVMEAIEDSMVAAEEE